MTIDMTVLAPILGGALLAVVGFGLRRLIVAADTARAREDESRTAAVREIKASIDRLLDKIDQWRAAADVTHAEHDRRLTRLEARWGLLDLTRDLEERHYDHADRTDRPDPARARGAGPGPVR